MRDNVNHPFYYQQEGRKECIEEIRDTLGLYGVIMFSIGNAMKYMYRVNDKGAAMNNVLKAQWYVRYVDKMLAENPNCIIEPQIVDVINTIKDQIDEFLRDAQDMQREVQND